MKIFTIESGTVTDGCLVEKEIIAGQAFPVIRIGEQGRGRDLGMLPVQLMSESLALFQSEGKVKIKNALVDKNAKGQTVLVETTSEGDDSLDAIIVFRTKIGFRGGNEHTGDFLRKEEVEKYGIKEMQPVYAAFPGDVICRGRIAQGMAGRMGDGEQLIAVMPAGVTFRTGYSGRLYGAPPSHYYHWNGKKLVGGLTWKERQVSALF